MVKYLPSHLCGFASTNIRLKDRFPGLLILWVALFARNITLGNQLIATAGELLRISILHLLYAAAIGCMELVFKRFVEMLDPLEKEMELLG